MTITGKAMRTVVAGLAVLAMWVVTAFSVPPPASAVPTGEGEGRPDMELLDPAVHDLDEATVSRHLIRGRDGQQTIAFDLIRPDVEDGVEVPTIMVSSPYYNTTGRGSVDEQGRFVATRKTPWGTAPVGGPTSPTTVFPEQYDELFVPRGYAVLLHDLRGTRNSSGCQAYGHRGEAQDAVDVIEWVAEQDWSDGAVAMIGGSYDGTIANGAASMAPEALKAIVPIRAIDRWYDYHHFNGVLSSNAVTPFNFSTVTPLTADRHNSSAEDDRYGLHVIERAACSAGLGPTVGTQYANPVADSTSTFWADRDYVKDAGDVTAAVWVVHGLDDTNVKPMNASYLYDALPEDVDKTIWWLRGAHDNPHNPGLRFPVVEAFEDELHRFFAKHLKGIESGAGDHRVVVQDEEGQLVAEDVWPAPSTDRSFWLTPTGLVDEEPAPGQRITYRDLPAGGTSITLRSEPLDAPMRISGEAFMDLTYALPIGGDTTFAYALQARTDAGVSTITRGYARGGFRDDIDPRGISYPTTPTPHMPGSLEEIAFPFWAADRVVPAGATLQLVISATDGLTRGGGNGTTELLVGPSRLVVPDAVPRPAPGL